ncbi:MAG: cardiolipin synthase ClsB [Panacagrimonas sp.]
MSTIKWVEGNAIALLENGEEFFPRVFEAIGAAQQEVLIETFILFEDPVGMELQAALIAAAGRGVAVDITVDGWGSCDLSEAYIGTLAAAGVRLHRADHQRRIFGFRPHFFRRLHRKLVVIDRSTGFIGGINYSEDHLVGSGPMSKQDYAAEVHGPVVDHMYRFMRAALGRQRRPVRLRTANGAEPQPGLVRRLWTWARPFSLPTPPSAPAGPARAIFVWRDNRRHRNDIERHYRAAIRSARQRLIIANAYFLPGFRLLRQLAQAARRGVTVDLILQGKPDMPMAVLGSTYVYAYLIAAGVRVHEYRDRPLHGKVAVMDDQWSTIGSSNLDPFSLSLNLEANLVVMDAAFNQTLRERLQGLLDHSCHQVKDAPVRHTLLRGLASVVIFHLLRWFPRLFETLPAHSPSIRPAHAEPTSTVAVSGEVGAPPQ